MSEKWGMEQADENVPPEIARLTGNGYKTFSEDQERLLGPGKSSSSQQKSKESLSFDMDPDFTDIIGPGPEHITSLDTIKASISALRPYLLKRIREKMQVVQVLEVFPSGESGYKSTMTLSQLLTFIHEGVMKVDNQAAQAAMRGSTSGSSAATEGDAGNAGDSGVNVEGEQNQDGSNGGGATVIETQGETSETIRPSFTPLLRRDRSTGSLSAQIVDIYATYRNIREIQYHDLRHLEHQFNPHEEPTVLVRRHAVLMSLNPLRAVVTADKLMLIVPNGADSLLYLLHEHMHVMVEDDDVFGTGQISSFELRAYKAMFATVTSLHTQEYISVQSKVEKVLKKFRSLKSINVELQEHIRMLKNTVSSQAVKVNAYRRLFKDLINSDDDVALMNLSLLKERPNLYNKPLSPDILNSHEEITILVESYLMDYNTLETKLEFLRAQIQNAEELMSFRLDTSRNELLIVDMTLAIVMVTLAAGTYVTSIFGMNLNSGVENDSQWWFWGTVIVVTVMIFVMTLVLFNYYRLTGTNPLVNTKSKNKYE